MVTSAFPTQYHILGFVKRLPSSANGSGIVFPLSAAPVRCTSPTSLLITAINICIKVCRHVGWWEVDIFLPANTDREVTRLLEFESDTLKPITNMLEPGVVMFLPARQRNVATTTTPG